MKSLITSVLLLIGFSVTCVSQVFLPIQKFTATDRSTGALFGATISISGNYAIAGAQGETEDENGNNILTSAGAAYIFELDNNGQWQQKQKLVPSDRTAMDYFGGDVAISGNTAVVGAYDKNVYGDNTYTHAGAVYIFEKDGNDNWNEIKKIVAADTGAGDHFGYKVAISGDYIIIGSPIDAEDANGNNTMSSAGSAYIIEKDGNGNWNQVQKIVSSDRAGADLFGAAVSISGNYALVGAYQEDEDSSGNNTLSNAGSAYLFERDGNGNWNQLQKITASDRAISDRYGISVSINGTYAIVGAYLEDEDAQGGNFKSAAGSAYIYERDNNGSWNQVKKIVSSNRDPNDYFGQAVYISGNYALAGSQNEATDAYGGNSLTAPGAAYLFKRDGNGSWGLLQKIVATDRGSNDYFGTSVTLDNNYILVGAHLEDEDSIGNNPMNASGSGYVFKLCNATTATINIATCASYTSPSGHHTFNSTGTYTDTILNNAGCDSILTIHLTIKNTSSTLLETVCNSYTSPGGHVWNQTNTYTDTIPNLQGCDSIITIHLTVNKNDTIINVNACDNYLSPDGSQLWTASGTYLDTLANSNGCDSIITVHLSINNSSSIINVAACNSYTSPSGNYTWTNAGTYLDTIQNTKGCDSLMTIHLSIGTLSTTSTLNETVCYSYTSPSGNYTWTTDGTYLDTIPNIEGCDSIITIHLSVTNATTDSTLYQNVCYNYVSPSGKYTWTNSGIYLDTIANIQGCDSLLTIHLTINTTYSTIHETACYNYVSPSNQYTWSVPGIYQDTIANSNACDSVITIHLTIANSDTTLYMTSCNSYTSPSGNYIWNSSNIYIDTIANTHGCDSIITVVLTINTVDTGVTQTGNMLHATTAGSAYQWLDCSNNYSVINNATNQQYTADTDGNYAVAITENGCVDTSECYTISISGLQEAIDTNEIYIYPNPASSLVTVSFAIIANEETVVELMSTAGQIIYSKAMTGNYTGQSILELNTSEFSNGMYLITVKNPHSLFRSKLHIENNN